MTNQNFNWHKRWEVDLSARTATHDSGLQFSFTQDGTGEWYGKPTNLDTKLEMHTYGN